MCFIGLLAVSDDYLRKKMTPFTLLELRASPALAAGLQ